MAPERTGKRIIVNFPLDLRVPDRKSQAAVFYISHSGRVVLVGWVSAVLCDFKVTPKAPPGGYTPLYKSYRYVPLLRLWVWAFPVCKRVYTLSILVWNRVWFSGELRQRVNVFTASIPNK